MSSLGCTLRRGKHASGIRLYLNSIFAFSVWKAIEAYLFLKIRKKFMITFGPKVSARCVAFSELQAQSFYAVCFLFRFLAKECCTLFAPNSTTPIEYAAIALQSF